MLERETFGFQRITVERPLVDEDGQPVLKKGKPQPDPNLRDQENVPLPAGWFDLDDDERSKALHEAAEQHLTDEIHPYVPDAWIDHTKTKIGVEIPFTRQFYVYTPPRPVEEIAAEIKDLEAPDPGVDEGAGAVRLAGRLPTSAGAIEHATATSRACRCSRSTAIDGAT